MLQCTKILYFSFSGPTSTASTSKQEPPKPTETCTIKIRGIGPDTKKETIEYYFKNKKRSGAGKDDTKKFTFDEEKRIAFIEFVNKESKFNAQPVIDIKD